MNFIQNDFVDFISLVSILAVREFVLAIDFSLRFVSILNDESNRMESNGTESNVIEMN
jgi:energy-coupling factor transporter transmembrane protein EcfT